MREITDRLIGLLTVFASAFCFYYSTVVIRWSQAEAAIDPAYFAFFRFLAGFCVVCAVMAIGGRPPRPRRYGLLVGRAVANSVAVYCFYMAVKYTSVAEANILNMTYPVFVALISLGLLPRQRDPIAMAMVAIAFAGIWLILAPSRIDIKPANLWGLGSGLSASLAIICLSASRRYHDVTTVLFFMFGLGAALMALFFHNRFFWPNTTSLFYLLLCAAAGIAGQFLITLGFRYITAVEGSIVSSSRILLAALLGPVMTGESPLSPAGWMGALLLFGVNAALAVRRAHPQ
jgi:drug/metabolite transporter (DMT)-like permease